MYVLKRSEISDNNTAPDVNYLFQKSCSITNIFFFKSVKFIVGIFFLPVKFYIVYIKRIHVLIVKI